MSGGSDLSECTSSVLLNLKTGNIHIAGNIISIENDRNGFNSSLSDGSITATSITMLLYNADTVRSDENDTVEGPIIKIIVNSNLYFSGNLTGLLGSGTNNVTTLQPIVITNLKNQSITINRCESFREDTLLKEALLHLLVQPEKNMLVKSTLESIDKVFFEESQTLLDSNTALGMKSNHAHCVPSAIESISTRIDGSKVRISWDKPRSDGGYVLIKYIILGRPVIQCGYNDIIVESNAKIPNSITVRLPDLIPYQFYVAAVNDMGFQSSIFSSKSSIITYYDSSDLLNLWLQSLDLQKCLLNHIVIDFFFLLICIVYYMAHP